MHIRQGDGAVIVGPYRYSLWRTWDAARPRLLWVLLNPSTADADHDDQTVACCKRFSQEWGYGGLEIVNLFAYRETNRRNLRSASDPIGPENDSYIADAATCAPDTLVGWGEHGTYLGRDRAVLALLARYSDRPPLCLGTVANGAPRHPARLSSTIRPTPYPQPPLVLSDID